MSSLTIYLLGKDIDSPAKAVEGARKEIAIEDGGKSLGMLYVKSVPEKDPEWTALFRPYTKAKLGKVQSTAGVYITKVAGRYFALTFGHGRFLLKPGAYEERFGLLVVLNSLKSNKLRSIDKRTFDTVDQNSRVQVSQTSSAAEFGVDIEKDLIRGITGIPSVPSLGSRMTGADPLNVAVPATLASLTKLLTAYLKAFESDDYKADFGWIDHISQVGNNSQLKSTLDAKLIERLTDARKTGSAKECWLAIPDIIDYQAVQRFRFSNRPKAGSHHDLHLPGFFRSLRPEDVLSIDVLKTRYAFAVDENDLPVGEKWTIYKCLHCEIDLKGETFLLASGRWFRIKKTFADEVNDFYNKIPRYAGAWIEYEHKSEGDYNEAFCEAHPDVFTLMDRKNISVGGVYDKIEFCDLYSKNNEIVHVKRYGGSGLLGHLFNQGLVSGEFLRSDADFLGKVNAVLPPAFKIQAVGPVPRDVSSFTIVFAIVSEDSGPLKIPFFARVALKHVCKTLAGLSYLRVMLAKVPVNATFSRNEKLKAAKKKATKNPKK